MGQRILEHGGGLPDGGNWPYTGVSVVAYETAERQIGAKPFDIPLRFPGQYFDAETQKHENWNRFYDPASGRYLSPEPLLQQPAYVRRMAQSGLSVPTYAYAANNPLRYSDPTGLWITVDPEFFSSYQVMKSFLTPAETVAISLLEGDPTRGVHITSNFTPGPDPVSWTVLMCRLTSSLKSQSV